ncbi:hypothetical protein BVRB_2g047300 isoform B [Beta vulgaris subsp. vulgaris]|uniref:Uncharacterized protein n=1 Tax=Beta vulgaris subsp. vulgaris TaxID=3555 RepID=A0A0J8BGJ3_BETVV|nr:hypothetical protein BVRB_2g047300 isoform B [Beta vulgaris subsp. vulgaris]
MARVKTTSRRRLSDGGRSDGGRSVCGPSNGGRGSKGDESVGKDVPNREGNTGDESVSDYMADFVTRRPTRSKKNTLAGRDKGPLRTCNSQSISEAEEEYNPHKRRRVSESTLSKPAGKKETNREGNTRDEFVGKDVPTIIEEDIADLLKRSTILIKDVGFLKVLLRSQLGKKETNREGNIENVFVGKDVPTILEEEAQEESNPHKRCRVSKSTPSEPGGKKETNREGNIEDEFVGKNVPTILEKEAEEEYNPHKRCQCLHRQPLEICSSAVRRSLQPSATFLRRRSSFFAAVGNVSSSATFLCRHSSFFAAVLLATHRQDFFFIGF